MSRVVGRYVYDGRHDASRRRRNDGCALIRGTHESPLSSHLVSEECFCRTRQERYRCRSARAKRYRLRTGIVATSRPTPAPAQSVVAGARPAYINRRSRPRAGRRAGALFPAARTSEMSSTSPPGIGRFAATSTLAFHDRREIC